MMAFYEKSSPNKRSYRGLFTSGRSCSARDWSCNVVGAAVVMVGPAVGVMVVVVVVASAVEAERMS